MPFHLNTTGEQFNLFCKIFKFIEVLRILGAQDQTVANQLYTKTGKYFKFNNSHQIFQNGFNGKCATGLNKLWRHFDGGTKDEI